MWIHAVSIGESTAALTFMEHIKKQFPDLNILITTITTTSAGILRPKIAKIPRCYHQFGVSDNPAWVRKFLDHWKPNVAIFLESEIWPNTVAELHHRSIPTFLLNARLSPRSFKRWKIIRSFLADILRKFTGILAQSRSDFERYSYFSPKNTKIIDNLKYANPVLPCNNDLLQTMQDLCSGKSVLVAASTHEGEENIILDAHKKVAEKYNLLTVIIPRHLTRIKRVCEIIRKHGENFSLRSELLNSKTDSSINAANNTASVNTDIRERNLDSNVILVDTFGEVGTFFRVADICFVGGSLVPIGGHNLYEPIALGKPVLHGIYTQNCTDTKNLLDSESVAFEINNSKEIFEICDRFFSDKNDLRKVCEKCFEISKNNSLQQIDDIIELEHILKSKSAESNKESNKKNVENNE